MKKNINILMKSMIALLFIFGVSCQKLEENPKGMSTSSNFYTTPEQCEAAFTASMNSIFNTWGNYNANVFGLFPDGQYDGASLDYGADYTAELWRIHYNAITNINAVLKAVKAGNLKSSTQDVIDGIVAQARYLRAFNYFTLVRMYGRIPFITEDTPDPVVTALTPESKVDISVMYDNLEKDLLFAIEHLADYDEATPAKPCLWTAKSLLAKVYLTRATAPLNETSYYAKARDMADDVIVNGPYELLPDFRDVFKSSNKNNREMIISFQITDDDPNMDGAAWAPSEWGGWSGGPVKPAWAEAYPDQPRKENYILMNFSSDLSDPEAPIINYTESIDGVPYMGKYNMPNITLDEQLGISRANHSVMRFADVLLIYAEAANMANNGPTQLSVDRLNMIIDRANEETGTEPRANISMTAAQFDQKVIDERNYELCFEYDRIFDVFRKRILKEVNMPDNAEGYQETDYLFPIPSFDATFIGNNPGYE